MVLGVGRLTSHASAEHLEAVISPFIVSDKATWDAWVLPEDGAIRMEGVHSVVINGKTTDRQINDRARDHTYN